jgi:hypothetical protein
MTRVLCLLVGLGWAGAAAPAWSAEPPRLDEVLPLLRQHLTGVSEAEINAAAVGGLLERLRPRVFLLTNPAPETAEAPPPLLARSNLFEGGLAVVRVGRVAPGLAPALRATLEAWHAATNLHGVVLDLRFADGEDFAAASEVADLFLTEPQPVLEWAGHRFAAAAKTNALPWRLAVLANRETRGAAEVLAAALHELRLALVLGRPTAGEAAEYREFPLSTGQRLRLAVAPVKVGPGGRLLPFEGFPPDIRVDVPAEDERRYVEDPFYAPPAAATTATATRAPRLTEADLVRIHRDGLGGAAPRRPRTETPPAPRLTDPVLARALDLLKSLAILESREP